MDGPASRHKFVLGIAFLDASRRPPQIVIGQVTARYATGNAPGYPALNRGWPLLRFLHSIGADAFTGTFMYSGDAKNECDHLAARLAFASLGDRERECTVTYISQQNPRRGKANHF